MNPIADPSMLRLERGHIEPEELAALTAVLLTRATAQHGTAEEPAARPTAGWRRLERNRPFHSPRAWHAHG